MTFTLSFTKGGTTGTFLPDVGFKWTDRLNVVNEANFVYSSSSVFNRSKVDIGATVLITEGASIEFFGYVDDIQTVDGGGLNVHATGHEGWLGREHGAYAGSPWTTTNNVTIFNALVGESTHLTAGSSDSFGNLDFRETASDSLWNAIRNLCEKTSQDLNVVYTTTSATIGLVDARQSAAGSRDILNYGKEIGDIHIGRSMPLGNKILVYGKGDGSNQIKSQYNAHGYDATSQATWGVITKIIEDYSVTSVAEANILADAEVARYKDPIKTYEFSLRVKKYKTDFIAGDTITINATDQGLTNEDVRITEIEKGMSNGVEYINLNVANAAYSRLTKSRDVIMAQIQKTSQQSSTFMQGTTNVLNFGDIMNGNNSSPLQVFCPIAQSFIIDESGTRRVNSISLDYNISAFNANYGTAAAVDHLTGANINNAASLSNGGIMNGAGAAYNATNVQDDNPGAAVSIATSTWTLVHPFYIFTQADIADSPFLLCWWLFEPADGNEIAVRVELGKSNYSDGHITCQIQTGCPSSSGMVINPSGLTGAPYCFYTIVPNLAHNMTYTVVAIEAQWITGSGSHNCLDRGSGAQACGSHTHSNSFTDANHTNANSFADTTHPHTVNINSGVSVSGSVNATGISWYLDYWSGSAWVNKSSGTSANLIGSIDISATNTYPDTYGNWRVRLYTNNASADLIQAKVAIKHQIDS